MTVQACVAQAFEDYRWNNGFLLNTVKDLSPEEWRKRPTECSNHIAWIVGHVTWARMRLLERLGVEWSAPWLGMFARGVKLDQTAEYPAPGVMMAAWKEVGEVLLKALENAPHEALGEGCVSAQSSDGGWEDQRGDPVPGVARDLPCRADLPGGLPAGTQGVNGVGKQQVNADLLK